MTGRRMKKKMTETLLEELVTVAFAEDMELAKQYKELLAENGIMAVIKKQKGSSQQIAGIAMLVPENELDEAHMLIEQKGSVGDFFGVALGDDSYDEIDTDYYDSDF